MKTNEVKTEQKSKKFNWTDSQRRAFDVAADVRIVSASAGSGKTSVMVKKVLDEVVLRKAPLSKILVLTFNIAAAAEVRERVLKGLYNVVTAAEAYERKRKGRNDAELGKDYVDPDYAEILDLEGADLKIRLIEEIDAVSQAPIKTVHAFALDVLREQFEQADFPPSPEILLDADKKILLGRAVSKTFDKFYGEGDALFFAVSEALGGRKGDTFKYIILKLVEAASTRPSAEQFFENIINTASEDPFTGSAANELFKSYLKMINSFGEEAEEILKEIVGFNEKYHVSLKGITKIVNDTAKSKNMTEFAKAIADAEFVKGELRNIKEEDRIKDEVLLKRRKKVIERFEKEFYKFKSVLDHDKACEAAAQNAEYIKKLVEVAKAVKSEYEKLKASGGKIDFNDLEQGLLKVLQSDAAGSVTERYDYVYVDEFQDINPLQDEIIVRLSKDKKTFFVGDIKQSIYGFRHASPELFNEKYAAAKIANQHESFGENFRSAEGILNFVNLIFDVVMTDESCGADYKQLGRFKVGEAKFDLCVEVTMVKMPPKLDSDVDIEGGIENDTEGGTVSSVSCDDAAEDAATLGRKKNVYSVKDAEEKEEEQKLAEAEGNIIARKIKKMVNGRVLTKDGTRKLRYGDFAILFRSETGVAAKCIIDSLKAANIPINNSSDDSDSFEQEENEIINLLSAVDNRENDLALVGLMLSPFGGFSENDLLQIKNYKNAAIKGERRESGTKFTGREGWFELCQAYAKDKANPNYSRLAQFLEYFDNLCLKASYKNVFAFVSGIISDTGYVAAVLGRPDGVLREIALNKFLSTIEKVQKASVSQFLDDYFQQKDQKSTKKTTPVRDDNRVTITTVHGSKGLEYEVVFVPNIYKVKNTGVQDLYKDVIIEKTGETELLGIRFFDSIAREKRDTVLYCAAKLSAEKRSRREEMRLLYVAMTRAKKKLFLTGEDFSSNASLTVPYEQKNCFASYIALAAKTSPEIKKAYKFDASGYPFTDGETSVAAVSAAPELIDPLYIDIISNKLNYQYNYDLETKIGAKYTVTELNQLKISTIDDEQEALQEGYDEQEGYDDVDCVTDSGTDKMVGDNAKSDADSAKMTSRSAKKCFDKEIDAEKPEKDTSVAEITKTAEEDIFIAESDKKIVKDTAEQEKAAKKTAITLGNAKDDAATRGILFHKVMEYIPFTLETLKEVEEFVARMAEDGLLTETEAGLIRCEDVFKCLQSDTMQQAKTGGVMREAPFTMLVPAKDIFVAESDEKVLVQGVIDLIIFGKRTILVDFKNSSKTKEEILNTYKTQLYIYKLAAEHAFGSKIDEMVIFSAQTGEEIRVV